MLSPSNMSEAEYQTRIKPSLNTILITMFLSSMGFTIVIPSLWLFFSHFDECRCPGNVTEPSLFGTGSDIADNFKFFHDDLSINGSTSNGTNNSFYAACTSSIIQKFQHDFDNGNGCKARKYCSSWTGVIVSSFPLAQLICSPAIAYAGTRQGVRMVLILSLLVMSSGYVLYSAAHDKWMLLAARFLIGAGAGNVSVLRFYASGATSDDQRTTLMAKMSGAQALGFVLGPGVGYALAFFLRKGGFEIFQGLRVDAYTAPGFMASILCLGNAVLVYQYVIELREKHHVEDGQRSKKVLVGDWSRGSGSGQSCSGRSLESNGSDRGFGQVNGSDKCLGRGLEATCSDKGLGRGLEATCSDKSLGRASASPQWDWRAFAALLTMFTTLVFVFSVYEGVGTQISECAMGWEVEENGQFLCAMGAVAVAAMLCLNKLSALCGERTLMLSAYCILLSSMLFFMDYTTPLPMWQWVIGGTLLACSFPVSQAMVYVLFSRIVPRSKQGLLMGYLTSAGSLARMIGPSFATTMYSETGFRTYPVFGVALLIMLISLAMIMFWWHSLELEDASHPPVGVPHSVVKSPTSHKTKNSERHAECASLLVDGEAAGSDEEEAGGIVWESKRHSING